MRCASDPFGVARGGLNSHVNVIPARARDVVAAVAGDAVGGPDYASQLLDVEMQQTAWSRMFVAVDGGQRPQIADAIRPEPTLDAVHYGPAQAGGYGDAMTRPAPPPQGPTRSILSLHVGR